MTQLWSILFFFAQVIDHYENPRNVGSLDKNDANVGTGLVGAPACGDVMKLQVHWPQIRKQGTLFGAVLNSHAVQGMVTPISTVDGAAAHSQAGVGLFWVVVPIAALSTVQKSSACLIVFSMICYPWGVYRNGGWRRQRAFKADSLGAIV